MNEEAKSMILAAIAAAVLFFVYTFVQGFLALYVVAGINAVKSMLGYRGATLFIIYTFGVLGSALSAMLINIPLGLLLTGRPWVIGAAVGVAVAVALALIYANMARNSFADSVTVAEVASLIIFSSLAAGLGNRMKRDNASTRP